LSNKYPSGSQVQGREPGPAQEEALRRNTDQCLPYIPTTPTSSHIIRDRINSSLGLEDRGYYLKTKSLFLTDHKAERRMPCDSQGHPERGHAAVGPRAFGTKAPGCERRLLPNRSGEQAELRPNSLPLTPIWKSSPKQERHQRESS